MHKIQFTTHCCKTNADCFPATRKFTILFPFVNPISSTIACTIRERHNWHTASVIMCCCLRNYEKDLRAAEQLVVLTFLDSVHLIAFENGFTFSLKRKRNESVTVGLSRHSSRQATGESTHVTWRSALSY